MIPRNRRSTALNDRQKNRNQLLIQCSSFSGKDRSDSVVSSLRKKKYNVVFVHNDPRLDKIYLIPVGNIKSVLYCNAGKRKRHISILLGSILPSSYISLNVSATRREQSLIAIRWTRFFFFLPIFFFRLGVDKMN